jgi:hypothetical protein
MFTCAYRRPIFGQVKVHIPYNNDMDMKTTGFHRKAPGFQLELNSQRMSQAVNNPVPQLLNK